MTNRPKFSVVTITFRDLEGLKRTVDSVRAQRYDGEIEHIVIDGGSGEDVVAYLSNCEPGFAYWQSEPDGGRYDALNQGISHATGDLLWLMHSSDCFSDPGVIAAVAEHIADRGPVHDLWGYGMANRVDGGGQVVNVWNSIPFDVVKFATARLPIPHQATFVGSALHRQIGGYDLDFGISADQLYILKLAFLRPPVTVDRVVCNFDISGAGSQLPIREVFANFRRAYRKLNYYPLGGRHASLAFLKVRELQLRAFYRAFKAASIARGRLGHRKPL